MKKNDYIPSGLFCFEFSQIKIINGEVENEKCYCSFYGKGWCRILNMEIENSEKQCNINVK
jgi:hypothetical protein